jgi:hypothetical protein
MLLSSNNGFEKMKILYWRLGRGIHTMLLTSRVELLALLANDISKVLRTAVITICIVEHTEHIH